MPLNITQRPLYILVFTGREQKNIILYKKIVPQHGRQFGKVLPP